MSRVVLSGDTSSVPLDGQCGVAYSATPGCPSGSPGFCSVPVVAESLVTAADSSEFSASNAKLSVSVGGDFVSDDECSTCTTVSDASWDGLDVWRYTRAVRGCSHIICGPPYSVDAVIVDYLRGLYPLMETEHRRRAALDKLRIAFRSSRECCPVGDSEFLALSAFHVSAILRCLQDVAWSGLWEEDEIDFEVTFTYDAIQHAVCSLCVFRVPVESLNAVRSDVVDWRVWASEWREARLEARVEALPS
ncbi:hypothetical protein VNI00_016208 [Paramarasmius palmivorus]|uniref:Uncharacterized protein n=1 Tax=Paramarasmius palmivorus TaxID=297713 RepID=A0AAW0BG00_9AGAR